MGSGAARPRTFAIVHGPEWRGVSWWRSGRGLTNQGSPGAFRAALQLPRGKEVLGREARVVWRVRAGGAEILGPNALSPANRGCSRAQYWRAEAAPLAASPSPRWPETRALPTKNSWALPVLLGLFKFGAAASKISRGRDCRKAWFSTGRD